METSCWSVDDLRNGVALYHGTERFGIGETTAHDLSIKLQRTYVYTAFMSVFFLTILPAVYLYIKDYYQKVKARQHDSGTTVRFCTGLLFIIMTIACFGGSVPGRLYTYLALCRYRIDRDYSTEQAVADWDTVFYSISVSYMFQALLLTIILYQRVYYVFRDTQFAVRYGEKCLFIYAQCYFFFLLGIMLLFLAAVGPYSYKWRMQVVIYVGTFVNILMTSWMVVSFVKRLRCICDQVEHHGHNAVNGNMLRVITKTSWLQWVSLASFVLSPILDACWSSMSGVRASDDLFYWFFGIHISVCIDMYVNFWCIMLSYSFMNPLYNRVCGPCHAAYARCCARDAKRRVDRQRTLEMMQQGVHTQNEELSSKSA